MALSLVSGRCLIYVSASGITSLSRVNPVARHSRLRVVVSISPSRRSSPISSISSARASRGLREEEQDSKMVSQRTDETVGTFVQVRNAQAEQLLHCEIMLRPSIPKLFHFSARVCTQRAWMLALLFICCGVQMVYASITVAPTTW